MWFGPYGSPLQISLVPEKRHINIEDTHVHPRDTLGPRVPLRVPAKERNQDGPLTELESEDATIRLGRKKTDEEKEKSPQQQTFFSEKT